MISPRGAPEISAPNGQVSSDVVVVDFVVVVVEAGSVVITRVEALVVVDWVVVALVVVAFVVVALVVVAFVVVAFVVVAGVVVLFQGARVAPSGFEQGQEAAPRMILLSLKSKS